MGFITPNHFSKTQWAVRNILPEYQTPTTPFYKAARSIRIMIDGKKDKTSVQTRAERIRANYGSGLRYGASYSPGIRRCLRQDRPAWQDYADGEIKESMPDERAAEELKKKPLRKHVLIRKKGDVANQEEAASGERVKRATRIYRKACSESGVTHCFFYNLAAWSDYIQGRIEEHELRQRAKSEIGEMRRLERSHE